MLRNAAEYSPPRRGGVDAPLIKWIRSEIGAAGVVSSAKLFRPKHLAELITITASRYRARASRPSAASSVASRLLLMPQPSPPLRGGEYPELKCAGRAYETCRSSPLTPEPETCDASMCRIGSWAR